MDFGTLLVVNYAIARLNDCGGSSMRRAFAMISLAVIICFSTVAVASEEGPTPEDITFVQGLLVRLGYDPGPLDGICGDRTVIAVRSFHEAHDLPLRPGHIEPQAATVVQNLTAVFAEYVMRPQTSAPEAYRKAMEGDGDAALRVGKMYRTKGSTSADEMLAYAWWSVAQMTGNTEASKLKDELAATGEISDHEMSFANTLAKQIHTIDAQDNDNVSTTDDKLLPEATM